ncbi:MAG: TetR/AcrR family transcriptional regulator [Xanthomonadaceae bacterium]|jgi:AcrR family transcriptional regulator|nr:TetR/AcrR family transcriptional regulator [Xanthomonadaceae bacterium]
MPRRSNAELSESTRASLLARATEAFAAHGYADAPLDELVRAAGLTKGALYHHFGSKQGLFEAVMASLDARITQRIEAALPPGAPTLGALEAACRAWLEAMLDAGARRILLLDGPAVLGHRAVRELDATSSIRPLAALLDELRHAGTIDPAIDAEPTAHLLAGALYEAALWIGEQPQPKRALPRAMAGVARMLGALAPPATPRRRT